MLLVFPWLVEVIARIWWAVNTLVLLRGWEAAICGIPDLVHATPLLHSDTAIVPHTSLPVYSLFIALLEKFTAT